MSFHGGFICAFAAHHIEIRHTVQAKWFENRTIGHPPACRERPDSIKTAQYFSRSPAIFRTALLAGWAVLSY
jgi:hypothetical protein